MHRPHSELQKWSVQGITRIGIFARKDIKKGEALSYDYQFSTNEHGRFRCHCGAEKCRGSLSSEGYQDESATAGKKGGKAEKRKRVTKAERKELLKKAKREIELSNERAALEVAKKMKRLNLTAAHAPGDATHLIKEGPKEKYFQYARESRLFLIRNLKQGNQMLRRQARLLDG